jgi:hypothetical protein
MNHTKQIVWLAVLLAFAIGLATYTQATPAGTNDPANIDRGEEVYTLTTEKAKKPATFPHWQHQDRVECAFCHDDARFIEIQEAGWTKDRGHSTCKDCHKATNAPKKCSTCHPKTSKKAYEGC